MNDSTEVSPRQKFVPTDYRFIAICLALLTATTWFSVRNFHRAFPEASIDFRVNREGGRAIAERVLSAQGDNIAAYREASSFTYDDEAKTFLEREAGVEKANGLMSGRIRLWRWSYRWFRPLQKEEFRADVTPSGEWTGFEHLLAEDTPRPEAGAVEARALAEDFLRARMHRDPAALEFVEAVEVVRPHRTDRTFTWKERDFTLHDATYRLAVTTLGKEVGAYREYLKIPEQWTRDYQHLRSKNEIAETVDVVFMMALLVGLVVVIVMRVRRRDIRWHRAATIAAVGMVLAFCSQLNSFPLEEFGYPTTDSYGSFLSLRFLEALLGALGAGGLLFVLAAGAEPVYRQAFPQQVSLGNLFRPRGLRTRRFFKGAILGITLTAIFVCYQVVFYIVAYRFGAWSPVDVPYDNLLNTKFPWLFVLFGGYFPAVSEEFLFRMFAIPFLRRLVRWAPLALVLAGFIWGFGHAGYAQQPFYIRGLEVGIGGVALGIVLLRWGILPTLVWHYSVDAMYSAMLLLRSHNLYFRLSGVASAGILVLPVIVALVAYWRRGGFEPETGLLNGDEPQPEEPVAEPEPEAAVHTTDYRRLSPRARVAALVVCVAGLSTLAVPAAHFGDSPKLRLSADRSRAPADAFLRQQGLDPGEFRHVTFPAVHWGGDDGLTGKYFLERLPVRDASLLFERYRPIRYWATRYFQSLNQEEMLVTIHPESGGILGFRHTLPEDRPGADLAGDAARPIAQQFASTHGLDLASMDLKESTSEKKKARRDHTFVWEARSGDARNVGEAHYRTEIDVAGDAVSAWRVYWKIPEAFSRARFRQNWISITTVALEIGAMALGFVWAIVIVIQNIRQGLVRWRLAIAIALPATLLVGLGRMLSFPQVYVNYPTAMPIETFQAAAVIGILILLLGGFLLLGGAAALVASSFPESLAAFRAPDRRLLGLDAGAAALAAIGLAVASARAAALLRNHFHAQALFDIGVSGLAASIAPSLEAISVSFAGLVVAAAAFAVLVLIVRSLSRTWGWIAVTLVAVAAGLPSGIRTPGEWLLGYGCMLIAGTAAVIFCFCFARRNYLAYALVFLGMAVAPKIAELSDTGNPALAGHSGVIAGVLVLLAGWIVWPSLLRRG
jgi:membrane protease YdiL (CAAX protease family)